MSKILIVGGPGSGKTTLGNELASIMGIDLYMLDAIGWENGAGAERSAEARSADIQRIALAMNWIAEGAFIGWTDPLADTADIIIWLDVPWRTARTRIINRHFIASIRGNNKHKGLVKLWRFLQFSKGFYLSRDQQESRSDMEQWLSRYGGKVRRCCNDKEVQAVVEEIVW